MKTTLVLSGALLVLAAAPALAADPALVERGAYVAKTADCVACHTGPSGVPYAGGRAVPSPFGDIYASNITPDPKVGIGGYSLEDFSRAVREGVRKDGAHLYPAMPYPSYSKLSDDDLAALYAYFMNGIKPVANEVQPTKLAWPFSMRWGIRFWNLAFAPSGIGWPGDANAADPILRGKYLVEGPGHCGSCHTPRGVAFQEKAYAGSDPAFLSGSELDGWPVPSLRAGGSGPGLPGWSDDEIAQYLATGRNAHSAVVGEMSLVIAHSTSEMKDSDLMAIAAYLKSLPAAKASGAVTSGDATTKQLTAAKLAVDSGARIYMDNCAACHFVDAKGAPPAFPPLAGNTLVNADNPFGMLHVILAGARLPSTPKQEADMAMPNFDWRLSDDEVAKLATFIRSSWGNAAPAVTAAEVAKVRERVVKENREPSSGPVFTDP